MKYLLKNRILYYILLVAVLFGTALAALFTSTAFANADEVFVAPTTLAELDAADPAKVAALDKFDSRDYGIVPAVRNQGPMPLCWSYASLGAMEIAIFREGIGGSYTKDTIDFSEKVIAWNMKNRSGVDVDPLGNTVNYNYSSDNYLVGGFVEDTAQLLMQWTGVANQVNKSTNCYDVDLFDINHQRYTTVEERDFMLEEVIDLSNASREQIKQAIVEYGSVTMTFYSTGINPYFGNSDSNNSGKHACVIVGWDDTIPASKFKPNASSQDGGWLIRNSWGPNTSSGINGYFYYSYDSKICGEILAFNVATAEDYDNNYYYDVNHSYSTYRLTNANTNLGYDSKAAAIYEAKGSSQDTIELLKAVNVGIVGPSNISKAPINATITVDIYTGVSAHSTDVLSSENNPESGTKVATVTRTVNTAGSFVLTLDEPISLKLGEYYSVVASVKGGYINYTYDSGYNNDLDRTYYYTNSAWKNMYNYSRTVARIKAFTDTVDIGNNLAYANVTVSPDTFEYIPGTAQMPDIEVFFKGEYLKRNTDYTVTFEDNILPGQAKAIIRGIGKYTGEVTRYFTITRISLNTAEVFLSNEVYEYQNNTLFMPDVTVVLRGNALVRDRDYGVHYYNNNYPGLATVIVMGIGDYEGQIVKNFLINPINFVSKANVTLSEKVVEYRKNAPAEPSVEVTYAGERLELGVDYITQYFNNTAPGHALVMVSGIGIYSGSVTEEFDITKGDIAYSTLALTRKDLEYRKNSPRTPLIEVSIFGTKLEEGVDYTLTYTNNLVPGLATATIKGIGNFEGENSINFTVEKGKLAYTTVTVTPEALDYTKNSPSVPEVIVTDGEQLEENVDYTVTYSNNSAPGIGIVTIEGMGYYEGQVVKTFTINMPEYPVNRPDSDMYIYAGQYSKIVDIPLPEDWQWNSANRNKLINWTGLLLSPLRVDYVGDDADYYVYSFVTVRLTVLELPKTEAEECTVVLDAEEYLFTGEKINPTVTVYNPFGTKLVEGIDYRVTVTDNINVGTGKIVIKMLGNYTGEIVVEFNIVSELSNPAPKPENPTEDELLPDQSVEDNTANAEVPAEEADYTPIMLGSAIGGSAVILTEGGALMFLHFFRRRWL